jgi:2-amino-4-hydroxy-6-hydroxymethyldihydropteridine diphosphokinase
VGSAAEMPWVWLSLGSNIERERHIRQAVHALRSSHPDAVLSSVYESEAEGFEGKPFYNLVMGFETDETPSVLVGRLRDIEAASGRVRGQQKFGDRTLDIDLLTYGDQVLKRDGLILPRDEITRYAFVLGPLAEVAGGQRHPVVGQTYGALWEAFDKAANPLRPVDFVFS